MVEESQHQRAVAENPRTTRVRKIVLGAAASLLIDEGHHAVTAQQVSKVTGIARSTIYRHWPYQASLLLDAIDIVLAPHQSTPNTGELGADLTNALESLRLRLSRRPFRAIVCCTARPRCPIERSRSRAAPFRVESDSTTARHRHRSYWKR